MSNIAKAFQNGKAFIPYITCGDPDLQTTASLVRLMAENGADLIELCIPFSDPTAESPISQGANNRALASNVTTDQIFDMVRQLRKDVEIPLVIRTYANIVFCYGTARFIQNAAAAGIDGLRLPDVPFEEKEEFAPVCHEYGIDFISMIAPASEERIKMIVAEAEGFACRICDPDSPHALEKDIDDMVKLVRTVNKDLPCAISLEMPTPEQAAQVAPYTDGVIARATVASHMEQHPDSAEPLLTQYVLQIKQHICI